MKFRVCLLFAALVFALIRAESQQEAVVDAQGEAVPVADAVEVPQKFEAKEVGLAEQLQAQKADLEGALKLAQDGLDTCHREMSEISLQFAGCEEARVSAKKEAKEAVDAESTMRHNARAAQEQVNKQEQEIESLKTALKARNEEIVELKLAVSELSKSKAALQAQTDALGTKEVCNRCIRESAAAAKTTAGVLVKQSINGVQAAVVQVRHVIQQQVLPTIRERAGPALDKAGDLYTKHAQPHVQQLKQQFDQHAGPYVQQAEQFYKQHLEQQLIEKSNLALNTAQKLRDDVSATVAAHPMTEKVIGRQVTASEVSQGLYTLWIVLASFVGMLVAWKLLKLVTCIITWPCRKLGLCGNNARAARQYKR